MHLLKLLMIQHMVLKDLVHFRVVCMENLQLMKTLTQQQLLKTILVLLQVKKMVILDHIQLDQPLIKQLIYHHFYHIYKLLMENMFKMIIFLVLINQLMLEINYLV